MEEGFKMKSREGLGAAVAMLTSGSFLHYPPHSMCPPLLCKHSITDQNLTSYSCPLPSCKDNS